MDEDGWTDGCRLDEYYTISSPCETNGSGELIKRRIVQVYLYKTRIWTLKKHYNTVSAWELFIEKLYFVL